ncbi:Membrane associated serine protease, rhomboid family [Tangfeifania diversioriginum]|uniref:Membrane associated serine protease, rhomboid family n=1 Tax=Tangfeifania diversioriginum TaxID=1168035 RepID=A0A1M6LC16_9BACT|nr:rhomboid family intramembrane serine protease [Tangfeifania diversioriginum]SHJ68709.1 Membrane associated serine protease, rhomboid family [Tangfeifania diversioriginum]
MRLFNYYPSNPKKLDPKMEKRIFIHSLILPALLVFVFWMVKITELVTGISLVEWGVFPREWRGLPGILFSPFIHSGFSHLISNSVPFFILFFALIYFYRRISYRIFIILYLLSGLTVWLAGRPAWHIGASGVVYALAAFHFVSGIIRNDVRLLTLSVVVVFLYGGMVWGLLPIDPKMSWEGHLWGAVSGVVLALYYRKYIIRRDKFEWEEEEEEEEEPEEESEELQPQSDEKKNSNTQVNSGFPNNYFSENTNHTGEY